MNGKIRKKHFASCMPLTPSTEKEMEKHIAFAKKWSPDFIEWRRDYLQTETPDVQNRLLSQLYASRIPLIYTFRSKDEGGVLDVCDDKRLEEIVNAVTNRGPAYVDLEVFHFQYSFSRIIQLLSNHDIGLILSAHFFDRVLTYAEMVGLFSEMKKYSPDVLKLAQMPDSDEEAQQAIEIVKFFSENCDVPIIHVLMGPFGKMSRVFPEKCGGSLTYVSGLNTTASGQISLEEVKYLRQKIILGENPHHKKIKKRD